VFKRYCIGTKKTSILGALKTHKYLEQTSIPEAQHKFSTNEKKPRALKIEPFDCMFLAQKI
jgi:hypothetical protein